MTLPRTGLMMQVDQAIVASTGETGEGATILVARSNRVDDSLAAVLCRWSPDRAGLMYGVRQAFFYFQPTPDVVAVGRSVVGSIDLHELNERQVITQLVILSRNKFARYRNNAVLLLYHLRSQGRFLLPMDSGSQLPQLEIAEHPPVDVTSGYIRPAENAKLADVFKVHQRVAVAGLNDPVQFMGGFLSQLNPEQRANISFSYGLQVPDSNPFQIYLFKELDANLSQDLSSRQIRVVDMTTNRASANRSYATS